MNREELEQKITQLVASQISLEVEEISPTSDFQNDLGFDSLDIVESVMCIEDEFGLDIKDEDADRLTSINLVVDYVEKNIVEE